MYCTFYLHCLATRYYLTNSKSGEEKRRGVKLVMSINVTHIKRGLAALMAIAKSHEEIRNTVHILGSTQHKFPT